MSLGRPKQSSSKFQMALVALIPLLCAAGARADVFDITFINVTFSATCIGETATCSEVINGSLDYNSVTGAGSNISLQLTGTLTASLDGVGVPPYCVSGGCFNSSFYDLGALPSHDPIEFSPSVSSFNAPTPEPVEGGPNETELYVPALCGGDQPLWNTTGAFPGDADAAYNVTSGTYTSVDVSPEPGSVILLVTGVAILGFLKRRVAVR